MAREEGGLGTNKNYHFIIIDIAFENPVPSVFAFAVKTIFSVSVCFYFGRVGFWISCLPYDSSLI